MQIELPYEECSTPFGITDYIGLHLAADGMLAVDGCSTPFGITDYIGWTIERAPPMSSMSAQRLSASRIISG